ncbi:hypothetical protein [Kitasatospora sp. NBC_01300]|uniref:hypothetical protein n=1 Tax=Kitasatospora sp. NBC_01300 TaxID=2903574 RepID=UPI00352FEC84|nr:hypothetical protein OG556_18405 [Kitasatospora sp. NBC_01300]
MPEQQQDEPQLTYDDAVRIRREAQQLDQQLARIVVEAKAGGRSAVEIARDLLYTEGRVHQLVRKHKAEQSD